MEDDFGDFIRRMFNTRRRRMVRIPREPPPPLTTIVPDRTTFFDDIRPYANEPDLRIVLTDANDKFLHEFSVRGGGSFKADFMPQFYEGGSGDATFIPSLYNAATMRIYTPQQLVGINLEQVFRDTNNYCVFHAIRKKFADLPASDIKKTNQNRQYRLNQINREALNYPNGVRADQLQELADKIKVKFVLTDILSNTTQEYGKARQIEVKIINTRKDHVDYLTSKEPEEVSQSFMDALIKDLRDNDEHYVIRNSTHPITNISTATHNYVVRNPDQELINEMNKQIKDCRYDALKYPDLNDFVKRGRIVNSSFVHFEDFTENTKLYDMKQAYTQHKECPFYEGFLYQIQQYRTTDRIHNTGIYQFTLHTDTAFSRMLGLTKDNTYILPSPEIKYWRQTLTLTITAGAWGNTTHIYYPEEVLQKKLYQRWAGSLSMNDNYRATKYTFPSTEEFAQHVKSLYPETFYWETKEASVNIPNKKVKVAHHIFSFITMYTRINMLLQMEKLTNIQAVLLDGIYTTDNIHNPLFQLKPITLPDCGYDTKWYEPTPTFTPPPIHLLVSSTLGGAGGTGKTHSILNDDGYIHPLYVVPTHELGHGKNYTTMHSLIGEGCTPYHERYSRPAVILIDELTMIPADFITRALQMYPEALIFVAGDLDKNQHYQCRSGNPTEYWEIWEPTLPIVLYTNDYRAKSNQLKVRKEAMREEMRRIYTDGGLQDTRKMRDFVKEAYPIITLNQAIAEATPEDIFLWSTKKVEAMIPELLHKLGVHKSQGQTLTNPKVYITMDWFEYAMPYTALSRCVLLNQVQFVSAL
jgi:hypothetical protein